MFENILPFLRNRSALLRSSYGIITSNEVKRKIILMFENVLHFGEIAPPRTALFMLY